MKHGHGWFSGIFEQVRAAHIRLPRLEECDMHDIQQQLLDTSASICCLC